MTPDVIALCVTAVVSIALVCVTFAWIVWRIER